MNCDELEDLAGALALGAALPAEVEGAARHLATCPDNHAGVRELAATAALLVDAAEPAEPPPALRGRILAAVRAEREERRAAGSPPHPSAGEPAVRVRTAVESTSRVAPGDASGTAARQPVARWRERRRPSVLRPAALGWLTAAAILLLAAGLGAWNLQLRADLDDRDRAVAARQQAIDAMAAGGRALAFATTVAGGGHGFVLTPREGSPLVVLEGMPVPGGGRVYQLWAIHGNDRPRDLGIFVPDEDGSYISTLPDLDGAQVVAITVEPGRQEQPTSSPVYTAPLS